MNVGIIGCGGIGQKRAKALVGSRLVATADILYERAQALAKFIDGVEPLINWQTLIARPDIDIVIVATTNDALAPITLAAVEAGKHVLVEKPAARFAHELEPVMAAAKAKDRRVRVGFNHRYHQAFLKAHELVKQEASTLGELMFIRGRYGHGGRVGYEKEWRANPALSGGGELIDQGVHLIDLSRWFMGEFSEISGSVHNYFWKMPVDDNAFLSLHTPHQQIAWLHVSCTEWKNTFSFEIYFKNAKLHIEGLGGSYGIERLTYYQMLPQMGPPATTIWEYPMADNSWNAEFAEFLDDIALRRQPAAGLADALAALHIVEKVYTNAL